MQSKSKRLGTLPKSRKRDDTRADRNIRWIEAFCRVPEGKQVGEAIKLREWQRDDLRMIYNNPAGTRRAIVSFGKKNGKTALAACLLLLHLCGPEAKRNTQLPSTAQSRDQAAVLFNLAAKMVRLNPALDGICTIRDSAKQILCPELGTMYRALSAEASTAHGQSPVFAVHDELGQVRGPTSELFTAIENAMGAHEQPMSIIISTQAPTDADLLSVLIDDALAGKDPSVVVSLYTADLELDPFSDEAIRAANPAFGDFLNPAEVRKQADNARRMPSQEQLYRNYTLNQRVSVHNNLFSLNVWNENAGLPNDDVFRKFPVYAGIDLSAKQDLTALVLVAKDDEGNLHVRCYFWSPADTIRERAARDRAPYEAWAKQGLLEAVPGVSIDYGFVAKRLAKVASECDLRVVRYDRWRIADLKAALDQIGVEINLEECGQGYKDMAPAIDALETAGLQRRLRHGGNEVLSWCSANAIVTPDPAGNRKWDKAKKTGRIDGMPALAMAVQAATAESDKPREYQVMIF